MGLGPYSVRVSGSLAVSGVSCGKAGCDCESDESRLRCQESSFPGG